MASAAASAASPELVMDYEHIVWLTDDMSDVVVVVVDVIVVVVVVIVFVLKRREDDDNGYVSRIK